MNPLVLVHGFMGGSAQWDRQIADLGRACDVVSVDLPGFGANAALSPVDTIEGFAEWVIDELEQRGIRQFDLLGHSMGGMIVQEIAHLVPDRIATLILYATGSVGVLPGRFETISESRARARRDGPVTTARRISATWFLDGEAAPAYPDCAAIAELAGTDAIDAGLRAMERWTGKDRLDRIGARTLVIWGDWDRTYKWEQIELLWQRIPAASLAVVPNCAHAVHLEKPDLFNQIVSDFLHTT